jgi:hypothetical protein
MNNQHQNWAIDNLYNLKLYGLIVREQPSPVELNEFYLQIYGGVGLDAAPGEQDRIHHSPYKTPDGKYLSQIWRHEHNPQKHLRMRYMVTETESLEFLMNQTGNRLQVTWTPGAPKQDALPAMLGPVMACLLGLRGLTTLHAGVISAQGGAYAFIGDKGAGKSSLMAALARSGCPILCDDIAALEKRHDAYWVLPAYPRLRAWPDTIQALTEVDPESLPRVSSMAEKRWLDLSTDPESTKWRFQSMPFPLKGVYYLPPRQAGVKVSIHAIPPAERLFTLVRHGFVDTILDKRMRARDLEVLGHIARAVPVRRLERPDGFDALSEVTQAILEDIQT